MPVYEYRCLACEVVEEHLQPLGAAPPDACASCGGELRKKFSRVAVRYEGWGFTSTDKLVSDTRGRDFKALRSKAEQIADE
ncbi:MAG TPA: zinc ribbon domain-containing protein [Mycobacteriales bacterium]|nr:zinc ribbon domain-containing protein [Mycobacteriales bacterium]